MRVKEILAAGWRLLMRMKFAVFAVVAALVLAGGTAAYAGSGIGGVFNLGVNNTVNAVTTLTGSVAGSSLKIVNNSVAATATALDLQVAAGKPPMKVNSGVKVANLNADKLDGLDSTNFVTNNKVRADGTHSSAFTDDFTGFDVPLASKNFNAPSAGFIMVTGSVSSEEDCSLTGLGRLTYNIQVDGADVFASNYELGYPEDCDVNGSNISDSGAATAVVPVGAGNHTVRLVGSETGTGSFILGRSVTSVFVPTGSGSPAPSLSARSAENPNQPE